MSSHTITGTKTFTAGPLTLPNDDLTNPATIASIEPAFQALLNRTEYLNDASCVLVALGPTGSPSNSGDFLSVSISDQAYPATAWSPSSPDIVFPENGMYFVSLSCRMQHPTVDVVSTYMELLKNTTVSQLIVGGAQSIKDSGGVGYGRYYAGGRVIRMDAGDRLRVKFVSSNPMTLQTEGYLSIFRLGAT